MRRRLIAAAGLVVVLPALDWAACALLQRRMHAEYDAWTATVSSQGWVVRSTGITEGGFPFGATLAIQGLDLAGGRAMLPGGLDWRSERVLLSLSLLHFWRLKVEPLGEQEVRVSGAKAVAFSADHLVASVPLGRARADRVTIGADGVVAGLLSSAQRQDVRIGHLSLSLKAVRGTAARIDAKVEIAATGLDLPDNGRWALGGHVAEAAATIDLASPALSGVAASEQARAWHDWGGVLTVPSLRLRWGPLDLHANATLNLDDHLQPSGHGTATVSGWDKTVDALAAGGTLPDGMAETVKMVMGLMSHAPSGTEDGSAGALSLPLTLQDNIVSVGKIPLIKLHTLTWNGPGS